MNRLFLAALLTLGAGSPSPASDRTNILFIAVDDLKPVLGCYGDPIAKTPVIDSLAARGTVFLNAQCQWPVCGPSRASLMTSLRPEAVGVMDLMTDMRAKNPEILTLPQHFRSLGYTTAGTGKIYDPRCVDNKIDLDAPSWSLPYAQLPYHDLLFNDAHQVVLAPEVEDHKLADGHIALSGIQLMRDLAAKDDAFFLAVGFKKPHLPFVAPRRYWDLYQRNDFTLAEHRDGISNDSGYVLHDSPEFRGYDGVPAKGPVSEALQRESLHAYYACVSFIDAQIGLLMNEFEVLDLAKNTIVVLWGDHGFHLGDHSMWGKHSTLEQAARVPLIVVPPSDAKAGWSDQPVELIDLFPTLCEFAGQPTPDGLAGRSMAPVIRGETKKIRSGAMTVFNSKGAMGYSYRTQRYRYTEWINRAGKTVATDLFDYSTDPLETVNLAAAPDRAELVKRLAASLRRDGQGCDRLLGSVPPVATR